MHCDYTHKQQTILELSITRTIHIQQRNVHNFTFYSLFFSRPGNHNMKIPWYFQVFHDRRNPALLIITTGVNQNHSDYSFHEISTPFRFKHDWKWWRLNELSCLPINWVIIAVHFQQFHPFVSVIRCSKDQDPIQVVFCTTEYSAPQLLFFWKCTASLEKTSPL